MNWHFVGQSLGKFLQGYALILTTALMMGIYDTDKGVKAFAITVLVTFLLGKILARLKVAGDKSIGIREGYTIVLGIWFLATIFGAMPLYIYGATPTLISAWFESVSGLTTTGATVIGNLGEMPRSILLWRSIMHWIGGVGIIMMFVAVLPHMGVGVINLVKAEASGPTTERLVPRLKDTAIRLWIIYSCLTLAEIVLLLFTGMSLFDAVNHSMSSMACGGFSTKDSSVSHFGSWQAELIIALFMTIAGGNFNLYMHVWRKGFKVLWHNTEFKTYIGILLGAIAIVTADIFVVENYMFNITYFRDTIFQVVSFLTGTGFASANFEVWPELSKTVLVILMFLGGCAGSTAGGLKIIRVVIVCKQIWAEIKRTLHPRMIMTIKLDNRILESSVLNSVSQFFALYMLTVAVSVLLVTACGLDFNNALSATLATLGNVGLGFGVVGPSSNAGQLPESVKFILSWCMLLGRLEFFTLLVVFQADFWRGKKGW